jgi:methionine sulfoxide reductase heme-binding subunit
MAPVVVIDPWTTAMDTVAEANAGGYRAPRPSKRPTLGAGRSLRGRVLFHHLPVGLASVAALVGFMGLSLFTSGFSHGGSSSGPFSFGIDPGSRSFASQLTIATGYVATVLLALTLLIGPLNMLLRRRNPVSSYLRRDLGVWVVILSAVHVALAFRAAYRGVFSFAGFFVVDGRPLTDDYGMGNWTGLAALVIAAGLLSISTTHAVRELGTERWKSLQRLNYTLFALVVLHAIFYGALMRTTSPFTMVLMSSVGAVLVAQLTGVWLWRRQQTRGRGYVV